MKACRHHFPVPRASCGLCLNKRVNKRFDREEALERQHRRAAQGGGLLPMEKVKLGVLTTIVTVVVLAVWPSAIYGVVLVVGAVLYGRHHRPRNPRPQQPRPGTSLFDSD